MTNPKIQNIIFVPENSILQVLNYKVITLTHRKSNLRDLGKFVLTANNAQKGGLEDSAIPLEKERLEYLKERLGLNELMYLATCNRITYFFLSDETLNESFVEKFFKAAYAHLAGSSIEEAMTLADWFDGKDAVRHIFEVCASLDSMVVGEREISKQVKDAYNQCKEWGLTGDKIRLAIKKAIPTAKKIYTNTGIAQKPVSVVSLAICQLLKKQIPLSSRFLFIGAGETNNLAAKFLLKHGFKNVTVFNRSLANAKTLAKKFNGEGFTLEALENYNQPFDIIIVCTGSAEPVLKEATYKKLVESDSGEKIIIDLAVPHNVERSIVDNFPVHYIEVDLLRGLANENMSFRLSETEKAKVFIDEGIAEFEMWVKQRQIEHALNEIPAKISEIKLRAFESVFHKEIEQLDSQSRQTLEKVVGYIEKKYMSIPMTIAKKELLEKKFL